MTAPSPKPASGNPTPDSVWHDLGMKKPYFPPFRPEERGKWMASENYKRALEALAKRGNLRENEPPPQGSRILASRPQGNRGPGAARAQRTVERDFKQFTTHTQASYEAPPAGLRAEREKAKLPTADARGTQGCTGAGRGATGGGPGKARQVTVCMWARSSPLMSARFACGCHACPRLMRTLTGC